LTVNAFSTTLVSNKTPAVQLIEAGQGTVMLLNNDPVNTVFLGNNYGIQYDDGSGVSPLGAKASLSFDGTQDVWATTAPGQTASVSAYPSVISFTNQQGITPLAQIGSTSGSGSIPIAGISSTPIVTLVDISGFASYDLNTYIYATSPGTAGSMLIADINIQWFDDLVSGIPVFEEDWQVWVGRAALTSGGNSVFNVMGGCGPMHGRYMSVNILNFATTGGTLQWFNLFGSNRNLPYSDWRQDAANVAPESAGLSLATNTSGVIGYENILACLTGFTVVAAARLWLPFNLYAGPAFLRFQASGALNNDPVISHAAYQIAGQPATGSGPPNNVIWNGNNAGTEVETNLILPRAPCYLTLAGLASGSIVVSCQVIAQQAA
jgi:hypothetical protein